jgi:GTP-binding protein EngB required for normal cell division
VNLVNPRALEVLSQERLLLLDLRDAVARSGASEPELRAARDALRGLEESFLLVVVGEFNSGKSSLLNALLGANVLAEGVTPTTDRVSILVHGDADRSEPYDGDPFVQRRTLPLQFLEGVALVDTPGTNAVIERHQTITETFLPRADLLLFLTSADRAFTESERRFLLIARQWSRKVVAIVNKADLLETDAQRTEVRSFVEKNLKATLETSVPVFLVSVRAFERTGTDAGFEQLAGYLREVLGERDRTRLKLLSPLGVAAQLLERANKRLEASALILKDDLKTLEDLERQLEVHKRDLQLELDAQMRPLDAVLDGVQKRGEVFIDDALRVSKTIELLQTEKIRARFERTVVNDAPAQLERGVGEVIDRFLARNVAFWNDTLAFLETRAAQGVSAAAPGGETRESLVRGARFDYDRKALLEGIGQAAQGEITRFGGGEFARQLADDAQTAVLQGGITSVGGIGLGALLAGIFGTLLADFTGILLGLTVAGVGFFILPRKRTSAKLELATKIRETRERLKEVLLREYTLETERAFARLREAVAPYTRFIRAEETRLEGARAELEGLGAKVGDLRTTIENETVAAN